MVYRWTVSSAIVISLAGPQGLGVQGPNPVLSPPWGGHVQIRHYTFESSN